MPNIAQIFKNETMRLAKKEVKRAIGTVTASMREMKRQNSALKKRVAELEKQLSVIRSKNTAGIPLPAEPETPHRRLGASSIRKLRARLGLNRHEMALLLDVNQNSIFLWEQGKAKPRTATREKIIALRTMRKHAVAALLSEKKETKDTAPANRPKQKKTVVNIKREAAPLPTAAKTTAPKTSGKKALKNDQKAAPLPTAAKTTAPKTSGKKALKNDQKAAPAAAAGTKPEGSAKPAAKA